MPTKHPTKITVSASKGKPPRFPGSESPSWRGFSGPLVFSVFLGLATLGCGGSPHHHAPMPSDRVVFEHTFQTGDQGWAALFTSLPTDDNSAYELGAGLRPLPPPLDSAAIGYMLTGQNRSDSLHMLLKRPVDGLSPSTNYRVAFEVEFATNVPKGLGGVGGAPGEAVRVRFLCSRNEPRRIIDESFWPIPFYMLDLAGADFLVAGDITNSQRDILPGTWEKKVVQAGGDYRVQSDSSGRVWLVVGTGSGFEGKTTLYYTRVRVTFTPM